MTDDEIIGKVVEWLATVTGRVVIQAHQSGPRPAVPYIMVNMTGTAEPRDQVQEVQYTDLDTENSEGLLEVEAAPVIEVEWQFSVHAYGATDALSTDLLRPVRSAVRLSQVLEPLFPTFDVHRISQTRNVPEYVNEVWEPRAQMDVMLRGLTRDGFVIDPIEQSSPFAVGRID